ncbi:MAG: molybdopterin dehydrogenase [Gemmataceae bacterium]
MKNFTYYRPSTLQQALQLLENRWGNTELLAGGTDLLDLQKEYVAQPSRVVSLNGIGGLADIVEMESHPPQFRIGAAAKLAAIAEHPSLQKWAPALTEAARQVGGPQIRNMGTLGGNLCQRNRCWYFRDEHVPCLLKGGDRCFALDGENQYHAVFTQGHKCVIVNPSTLAPALIALEAKAEIVGPNGTRSLDLKNFFQAPAGPEQREHVLAPNEILTAVRFSTSAKNASYEVRHKQSYDWPLVQAAVAFQLSNGKATNVRIVLGHVAPTPLLSHAAAEVLEGKEVNEETAAAAGRAATEGTKPLSKNGYKIRLIEVAVKRAILLAAGVKPYWLT